MRIFVCPGQGSQSIGMGKGLAAQYPAAAEVFAAVDEALSQNLSRIIWEGPEDALTLTENTQPALMAASVAVMQALASEGFDLAAQAQFVAGHSLGEYAALVAAGSLPLADAARLLKLRGQAMQRAVPIGEGAMAAILGLEFEALHALTKQASTDEEICSAANDNAPGQVVISGHAGAVARASALAKQEGAKRVVELAVSAPFHCALMQPAAEAMAAALAETTISAPALPVIANVTATAVDDPEAIRVNLVQQVTGVVRWRESMQWAAEQGVTSLIEAGAGKVLTGMAKRIDRRLTAQALNTPADIEEFLHMTNE